MKNFHPKTYNYVHVAARPGVSDPELYVDGLKRDTLYILNLWADQTNIYTEAYLTTEMVLPAVFIPNGNYTGEEKIIHVVGQKPNATWPWGGILLSSYIGESTCFDSGQAGLPGVAGMTEFPQSGITMMRGSIVYLRWFSDRWLITSASRIARTFDGLSESGPAVVSGLYTG
jgi:hypothetical protein